MRRWIGNHLILLAYSICPALKAELNAFFQSSIAAAAEQAAAAAAQATAHELLAHQQRTALLASRQ